MEVDQTTRVSVEQRGLIRLPKRSATRWVVAVLLYLVLVWMTLAFSWLPKPSADWIVDCARLPLWAMAIWFSHRNLRLLQQDRQRSGWLSLWVWVLAGCCWFFLSDLLYAVLDEWSQAQVWMQWPEALAYSAMFVAMWKLPRDAMSRQDLVRMLIDFFIVMIGLVVVVWFQSLSVSFKHVSAEISFSSKFFLAFFPLANLLLCAFGLLLFLQTRNGAGKIFLVLFSAAFGVVLLESLLWKTGVGRWRQGQLTFSDLIWQCQSALFAVMAIVLARAGGLGEAAFKPIMARDRIRLLPHASIALGLTVWLVLVVRQQHFTALWLGICLAMIGALLLFKRRFAMAEQMQVMHHQARIESSARLAALLEHMSDAVLVLDDRDCIQMASLGAQRLLKTRAGDLLGKPFGGWLHADDVKTAIHVFERVMQSAGTWVQTKMRMRSSDQSAIWVEANITNLIDDEEVRGIIINLRDVSAQTVLESQLRDEAFNDRLTGLSNRSMLYERAEFALKNRNGNRQANDIAILLIDLDGFKNVNDSMGHVAGDGVIKATAVMLQRCVRDGDTVARMGGDEFAILLESLQRPAEATYVVERVLDAMQKPLRINGQEITITASIGVALAELDDGVDEVIRKADVAMYRAKSLGRARYQFFEPELHKLITSRIELRGQLADALEKNELALVYQPVMRVSDRRPTAIEALIRWHRGDGNLVPADSLIKAAEESGLMLGVGRWVITQALREYAELRQANGTEYLPALAINISPMQLQDYEFADHLLAQMKVHQIPARDIVLEVHASVLSNLPIYTLMIDQLAGYGLRIVLDDFGTGSVSLELFSNLPLAGVKLDRSFITDVATAPQAAQLVEGMIAMCRSLDLNVAVKAMESVEQLECLMAMGCEEAQGYLFSPAMPIGEMKIWLKRVSSALAMDRTKS